MRNSLLILIGFSLCCSAVVRAQSAPILMDGSSDDWTNGLFTFIDPDAPIGGVDLLSVQVSNDDQYLYIKLALGSETDLLDDLTPQTIRLYIDGDNNASTGTAVQSGYGAELQIRFDTRTVTEYFGANSNVSWSTIDLVPLPTVTSDTFEVAIARNAMPDGVNALFSSPTIKLLFKETDGGDALPNVGSTLSYTFDETPVPAAASIEVGRSDPSLVRIMSWNVLSDGITNASLQGNFQRMLAATSPDILGLSECVSSTAAQVKTRLDAWLPIGGAGWNVVKDDFDMIVASRWPILQSWPALSRQFPTLIDLPDTYATDLLFTAAHLNCCTADATRQNQADAYVQFVLDAKTPGGVIDLPAGTPMVYSGDLNLVGYAQQLRTLVTGDIQNNATYGPDGAMDWDGTSLVDVVCRQTEGRMAYTWRSNTSAYPSGRLDLLLYSDAVATVEKSFALRTGIMSPTSLSALGLLSNDATSASDHFPIVVDMAIPLSSVSLNVRAMLEGPFDAGLGLMHDSLRVMGLIPLNEPYTFLGFGQVGGGGEAVDPGVLDLAGTNAVVDWVLVELRDHNDPTVIQATRCGLIQRDGDIVDASGFGPLKFDVGPGVYFVAVRHRNHLGVMTADPITIGTNAASIDLTEPNTMTYGTQAQKALSGSTVLWAGNARLDNKLIYTGQDNDRDPLLSRIGGVVPTNVALGYFGEDMNLDGRVLYTGANNDRDRILSNIGGVVPTATRTEQLP